jgi:hypothetical protein
MVVEAHLLLQETLGSVRNADDALMYLTDNASFESYVRGVVEAIPDKEVAPIFETYMKEVRNALLSEATILSNPQAYAVALAYFPVLAELYAKPVLSQLLTPWFVGDNGRLTVPLIKRIAQVVDGNGNVIKEVEIPKPIDLRSALEQVVTVNIDDPSNLFDKAGIPKANKKVLLSETAVVKVSGKDSGGNPVSETVYLEVEDYKNNQGEIHQVVQLGTGVFRIDVTINAKTGDIYVGKTTISNPDKIVVESVDVSFIPVSLDASGEFRIRYKSEIRQISKYVSPGIPHEVETDPWEDFEKALFDINYLTDLAQKIRDQIQLMKDTEVSNLLMRKEADIVKDGRKVVVDFSAMPPNMTPADMADVYSFLMNGLIKLSNIIYNEVYVTPNYLAVNPADAHIVEGFIEFSSMWGGQISRLGVTAKPATTKFTVLKSPTIPQGKMYFVAKPAGRQNPVFVDAILRNNNQIIKVQNDIRTKVIIIPNTKAIFVDPRKVGVVELKNIPNYQ